MRKVILVVNLMLTINVLSAQKLIPYYSHREASESIFANNINVNECFSDEDINQYFTNIDDLSFLKEVVTLNKVVLMGETHYATNVYNLRNRLLFALNTYDYYPLIIIELPYSIVEYFNYYVHLLDDEEAHLFLTEELSDKINTEEDILLLNHIRRWNKLQKNKPISIGGTDLEFSYQTTIKDILCPFFTNLSGVTEGEAQKLMECESLSDSLLDEIDLLNEKTKKENIHGKYTFISTGYIDNVIQNLHDTNKAFNGDFNYVRHNSIVNKLTSDLYFGEILKTQKVMLHGGGDHMKSKLPQAMDNGFYSEGIYLNHSFPKTKGCVYSIMAECFAYSLGRMKDRDIEDCLRQGRQYRDMISLLNSNASNTPENSVIPYFIYEKPNLLLQHLSIYYFENKFLSLTDLQIESISRNRLFQDDNTKAFIKEMRDEMAWYDKFIIIPASKIATARLK